MTPFIFLHVPKTAGTTLRAIIERQYAPEEVYTVYDGAEDHHSQEELKALSPEAQKSIKAYCGHVSFGVHRHLEGKPKYITMLRDPVERVISYYHHAMTLAPQWRSNPISLMKFIQGRKDVQVDNLQTRLLSGIEKPFGACTEEMLWAAAENLDRYFAFACVSEMFDESLCLIAESLNWDDPFYVFENVGRGRPSLEYFSQMEINVIRTRNQLDLLLYSYVRRRFESVLANSGEGFRNRLATFKDENEEARRTLSARAVW